MKPSVVLVAHGVHDHGGMERACAELLRRTHEEFDFIVISAQLDPALRALVKRWVRIRVPMRPIPLKYVHNPGREKKAEGIMLKRRASPYRVGRQRGDWWKWKVHPFTIDAVLIYAQPGSGKRAGGTCTRSP